MRAKNVPRKNLRVASIPSTSLSLTALSTVFAASLTVSVALFRLTKEVEKARGANRDETAKRLARGDDLARKDIICDFVI